MTGERLEALVGRYWQPLVFDFPPEDLNQVELWRVRGQENHIEPLLSPFQRLALKRGRAMHAGVVEYDDRKSLWRFLLKQDIEGLDDHLSGNRLGGCVVNQLALATQKTQHIKPSAMGEGRDFQCFPDRTPGVRHGGVLRKPRFIEVVQLSLAAGFPLLKLPQQGLGVAKIGFITTFFQRSPRPFKAIPQIFLKPA